MELLLDNERIELGKLTTRPTVADAIEAAKSRLAGTGSIIVALRHDDNEIPSEDLPGWMERSLDGCRKLELVTGDPIDVVAEAIDSTRTAFASTFVTVRDASDAIAKGDVASGMQMLQECVSAWGDSHEAVVQGGRLLRVDFDRLNIGGRPLPDFLRELTSRLAEIKQAIASGDLVLLGDLLRYEIDDTLRAWEQLLNEFSLRVRRGEIGPANAQ